MAAITFPIWNFREQSLSLAKYPDHDDASSGSGLRSENSFFFDPRLSAFICARKAFDFQFRRFLAIMAVLAISFWSLSSVFIGGKVLVFSESAPIRGSAFLDHPIS